MKAEVTWIDASEDLPDDGFVVLLSTPDSHDPTWFGSYDYEEECWRYVSGARVEKTVTHWAELPASPVELATS